VKRRWDLIKLHSRVYALNGSSLTLTYDACCELLELDTLYADLVLKFEGLVASLLSGMKILKNFYIKMQICSPYSKVGNVIS
jgi:hypothetical protein